MLKQNTIPTAILSAFAFTAIFLLAAVSHGELGAPLKGIDVPFGKPDPKPAAKTRNFGKPKSNISNNREAAPPKP